jgi:hypothetical protein
MLRLIGARAGPVTIIDAGAGGSAACNGAMPTVVSTVAKASKMERADMAAISRPSRLAVGDDAIAVIKASDELRVSAEQKQYEVLLMAKIEEHPLRVEIEHV